jgi:hypothetical protein
VPSTGPPPVASSTVCKCVDYGLRGFDWVCECFDYGLCLPGSGSTALPPPPFTGEGWGGGERSDQVSVAARALQSLVQADVP